MNLQWFLVVTILVNLQCSGFSMTNFMNSDENEQKSKHSAFWTRRDFVKDIIDSKKQENQNIINVDHFGANGDGSNDAKAFMEAWKKACKTPQSILLVPANKTYLLNPPIRFLGPCKPGFIMRVHGTIKASSNLKEYEKDPILPRTWVVFYQLNHFTLDGGGTFDGNGQVWWETSCKVNNRPDCRTDIPPKAVMFNESMNLKVMNLRFLNAQQMHLTFDNCKGVEASNLLVIAPEESPNTDGIHVFSSQNMNIKDCIISTGDDCLSIVAGSNNIRATNIRCGPGHGISIGSLGKNRSMDVVSDIHINKATLLGTTNGVRIKTWQGGRGYAHNIRFEDIRMINVTNPIIIDQNYCDQEEPCHQQNDAVQVNKIVYKDIRGTSATDVAIRFNCSKTFPCEDIELQNVHLFPQRGGGVKTLCANAELKLGGYVSPGLLCN
ncbi:hypothetical protein LIER_21982 [Lithospermum erythrorhizon]|uniref:endo-polygalacturonase n=1 Tax=Lithospermum erythrorhizon TaxID=34254 RepID=A0AAV3QUN0_LITER